MECFEQKFNCFEQSKLLKYEGVTVEESWNNEGFQTKMDTLQGADIDIDKPFWDKQIDENLFVKWNKIPKSDQKKLQKYIIKEDNIQFKLEKEKEMYLE